MGMVLKQERREGGRQCWNRRGERMGVLEQERRGDGFWSTCQTQMLQVKNSSPNKCPYRSHTDNTSADSDGPFIHSLIKKSMNRSKNPIACHLIVA